MKNLLTKGRIALLVVFAVLIIDQLIKISVKTQMYLHQSENAIMWLYDKLGIETTDPPTWFYIFFTENNGMAFGMELFGKLFLTVFRIAAVVAIAWLLHRFVKLNLRTGFIVCVSLVLAGALGNIIDSVFYGVLFSESNPIATFLPEGGGYAPWFYGKVVDMFYFPIIDTDWPQWMPFVGGKHFVFFSPIFNFADAAISCGIIALLIFYSRDFNEAYRILTKKKK